MKYISSLTNKVKSVCANTVAAVLVAGVAMVWLGLQVTRPLVRRVTEIDPDNRTLAEAAPENRATAEAAPENRATAEAAVA